MPSPKKVAMGKESSSAALRHKAEEQWNRQRQQEPETSTTKGDLLRILHELEVHQIELEMQQDELVRSHAALEVSLNQYSELYDFAPVGYFSLTQDGTIKRVNLTGAGLLGIERGKLIDQRFAQFVANEDRLMFSKFLQKVFSTDQGQESCEIFLQADDSATSHWVQIEASLPDEGSECKLVMLDITDRKRVEAEFHQLNANLEKRVEERTAELVQSNRVKDEFLSTMSHELRTPLNSILGMSEILLDEIQGSLNNRQYKSLEVVHASGQHLLELINDILDLSKIGAGKFDYFPQMVNANTLCKSCLAFVKEQALHKSIELVYEEDETNQFNIYADLRRMKQVLINLLSNAVKFTMAGGKVTLQTHADEVRQLFQFSVVDTGIGISQADLKRLFQPFVQVDSALNRQFDGTGLGLALVQRIINIHGGSIEAESEIGKGSRFTVSLPWDRTVNPQQASKLNETHPFDGHVSPTPSSIYSGSGSVLLADDTEASAIFIGDYLKSLGYTIVVAHEGIEALHKAKELKPNIILMDIQMPKLDGLAVIQQLRADQNFRSTPIIALTALAMPGDQERCLNAGADAYMSKPVSLKTIANKIQELLRQNQ